MFDELDLTAPENGAWSGLLSSLTWLKDVKLIHIRKALKYEDYVRFEPEDEKDSTFQRYVQLDTEYDSCGCDICMEHAGQDLHGVFAEYRLGTDAKKEDWTRGLELMVAGSRTVQYWRDNYPTYKSPDP